MASSALKGAVDLRNVQGIVRYGYGRCDAAQFVLLRIRDPAKARGWLGALVSEANELRIRDAQRSPEPGESCVNVAFTCEGLERLGVEAEALAQFSREFQEGMAGNEHRSRVLGDHGESDPGRWRWGGPSSASVHVLLLLYATESTIADFYRRCTTGLDVHGLEEVAFLPRSSALTDRKEHFGFIDGIGQPQIAGLERDASIPERWEGNRIALGEVLLGYPNEYGQLTERPLLGEESDPGHVLSLDAGGSGKRDLGRDGTYLVFRQLGQDVAGFWRFLDDATGGEGRKSPDRMVAIASKLVGRRPNGDSLVQKRKASGASLAELRRDQDRFDYDADPRGLQCPLGAHVRRANPRGSMLAENGGAATKEKALGISRKHRIVRRGRSFGPPLDPSLDPQRFLDAPRDGKDRGLYFVCLNASISRQFEFLQQAWINNPKFQGLYDDADPLVGARLHEGVATLTGSTFTVPAMPVRHRYLDLPRFVSVLGGAYFFLPSIAALRFMAIQR